MYQQNHSWHDVNSIHKELLAKLRKSPGVDTKNRVIFANVEVNRISLGM